MPVDTRTSGRVDTQFQERGVYTVATLFNLVKDAGLHEFSGPLVRNEVFESEA
jgi:hypothetical protein